MEGPEQSLKTYSTGGTITSEFPSEEGFKMPQLVELFTAISMILLRRGGPGILCTQSLIIQKQ